MKAHLLNRSQDFDWKWALQAAAKREAIRTGRRHYRSEDFDPRSELPWNTEALTTDLALNTLFNAMAQEDDCVFEVSRKVVLAGATGDLDTIRYRQPILHDCLNQAVVVRKLYALAVEAMEEQKGHYLGSLTRHPEWVLRDSIETIATLLEFLKKLRTIADLHAHKFVSEGWAEFFAMLKRDLGEEYFAIVQHHLEELRFPNGELLSAELGKGNKATGMSSTERPIAGGHGGHGGRGSLRRNRPSSALSFIPAMKLVSGRLLSFEIGETVWLPMRSAKPPITYAIFSGCCERNSHSTSVA